MKIKLAIYKKTIKVKYSKRPQSLLQMDYSANIRKWMKVYFPGATYAQHQEIRDKAYAIEGKLKKSWWKIAGKAFWKIFKRPLEIKDYRVSGVCRDEFPEKVKKKLRELVVEENTYHAISYAHNLMLPATMKKYQ